MRTNGSRDTAWPVTAKLGAAGIGGFFLTSLVAGSFKPGYSHLREAVSALAATDSPAAPVMIAGFLGSAIGMAATGAGLRRRLHDSVAGRVAAVMVMFGSVLMVVAGLARQDCSERLAGCIDHGEAPLASTHFWVHQFSSLALFLLLTVALFVMARGLKRSDGWQHLARPARFAGLFTLLCIAGLMVDPPLLDPYAGLFQRVFVLVLFGMPVLAAGLPRRDDEGTAPATPTLPRTSLATHRGSTVLVERSALTPLWPGWVEPMRPGNLR